MPITITMPRLSDTMQEGTLNKWHVKVGDKVKSGDILADVETDKATMELQAFDDGTVAVLSVQEGQTVAVGKLILVLAGEGESVEQAAGAAGDSGGEASGAGSAVNANGADEGDEASSDDEDDSSGGGTATAVATGGKVKVSPLARKLAEDKGVDVTTLTGSGPGGRVIKRDVLAAAGGQPLAGKPATATSSAPAAAPVTPSKTTIPAPEPLRPVAALESKLIALNSMRKTIARRLVESKTTIPHFTVTVSVNMDPLLALRETLNGQLAGQGIKLSVNDFIVRAAALACVQHPVVNSSWTEQGVQQHGTVNIGVAVSLPDEKGGGLVVPVIRDAQNKGLRSISSETKALAEKARGKGLTAQDMAEGTFTLSNLGMFGVEHFEAIINPPQAAILAVGSAVKKPVVRNDQIVIGQEMTCTLSADHRVIDGSVAATYLATLRQLLENPAALLV